MSPSSIGSISIVVLILVSVVACEPSSGGAEPGGPSSGASHAERGEGPAFPIRSITLDARHRPEPELLRHLRTLGTTHLTLITFGWQRRPDDPSIRMHTDGGWYSESDAGVRQLARAADALGMGVILKPHVWIGHYDTDGQARDSVGFATEAQWATWEADYRRFLMHYARLAADVDAAVLVLGTELSHAAHTRPQFWRGLADSVRTVYGGRLTYAANWYGEYDTIPFWDALDYVGVQAYFPLVNDSTATDDATGAHTVDVLHAGWRRHREALRAVHEQTGKPILFTEVGYRSVHDAAAKPWRWPERDEDHVVPADSSLQARCYEAFFRTFNGVPWFEGAILWKWHPSAEGDRPLGFTPQNKPAESVIRHWFRDPRSGKS